jgi:hypothetical protein
MCQVGMEVLQPDNRAACRLPIAQAGRLVELAALVDVLQRENGSLKRVVGWAAAAHISTVALGGGAQACEGIQLLNYRDTSTAPAVVSKA